MAGIVSIGDLLIDFSPAGEGPGENPLYEMNEGGACANVAAAAARLGCPALFIGNVGDDAFGRFAGQKLEACGVGTQGVFFDGTHSTTLAFVHLAADGDRSFSFVRNPGAETCLTPEKVCESLLDGADILHFGSIPLSHNPSRDTIMGIAKKAFESGKTVSYDPNLRRPLWDSLDEAREVMRKCLSFCHILKVSEEELEFLTGNADVEEAAAVLAEQYHVPLVLATLGKDGVYCKRGDDAFHSPAFTGMDTVDTTGAGDCYIGSFIAQAARVGFDALIGDTLREAVRFSNAAAGLATTKKGAIPAMPSRAEVEVLLGKWSC